MPTSRTIWLLTFSITISFVLAFTGCENKREKDGKPGAAISSKAKKMDLQNPWLDLLNPLTE